jgi:error-prone DNA polymerase
VLEQLAWSGACDVLLDGGRREDRRSALWQLGVAAPAERLEGSDGPTGTQLALPFELASPPRLRELGRWQRLIADYSTTGVTVGEHALAILRPRLTVPRLATSAQLARLPSAYEVAVAGLVIARQRPGTAGGTMFLLFEDEFGTINLVVPKHVYERYRQLARAEPLLLARGRLERSQERPAPIAWGARHAAGADGLPAEEIRPVINVVVRELASLGRFVAAEEAAEDPRGARVHRLPAPSGQPAGEDAESEPAGEEVAASMRAAAPAVQSFAMGRRR